MTPRYTFSLPGRYHPAACAIAVLCDGPGDLQLDELVVVESELTEDLVGVFGELRGTLHLHGRIVELDRVRNELLVFAVGVDDVDDPAVGEQSLVVTDVPAVLHRSPGAT